MGVDLHVYTPSEDVLTAEELGRHLRSEGWDVRLTLDQDRPVLEPAPGGPLTDLLNVMGWPISSDKASLVAEAIDRRDLESLQLLYDEGVVGACGYSVLHPFDYKEEIEDEGACDMEDEDEGEDEQPIEASCLEAMHRAKARYGLRVRNAASKQSYRFLNVVWQAIGRLRGGLLVDPQFGEFRSVEIDP